MSYRFNAAEMQYVIDNSDATVVVVDAEQAPLVASVRDQLPKVRGIVSCSAATRPTGSSHWDDVVATQTADATRGARRPDRRRRGLHDDLHVGHHREAQGCDAHRHRRRARSARCSWPSSDLLDGPPVHLTTGPLYHSGPLSFALFAHALGGTIVVLRKFDPTAWLRLVKEHRVTDTFTAPTQLKRIVTLPPGELARRRSLVDAHASSPTPRRCRTRSSSEVIEKLGDGFLYEVYGSTELGVVTVLPPEDQLRKPGSCGKTYGPIEVRIVRDDGSDAPTGEPGELFIRTTLEMDGYHHTDEQLTAARRGSGSRSATSRTSTTRTTSTSATARRT